MPPEDDDKTEVLDREIVDAPETGENDNAEEEVLTVQIGDDAPDSADLPPIPEGAPDWIKNTREIAEQRRKDLADAKKRIKELEAKTAAPAKTELPPKPTRADYDYNDEEYDAGLLEWYELEREHKAAEASAEDVRKKQDARWQQRLATYEEGKAKLGVKDFDEAEDMVRDILAPGFNGMGPVEDIRINIIKQGAKDPNLVIYALGKNAKRAAELAAIEDPVEFAMAVGRMEGELKVTRKAGTQPERTGIDGAGTGAGSVDNTLERLRAEAAKSGDFTKVTAYKRKLRAA